MGDDDNTKPIVINTSTHTCFHYTYVLIKHAKNTHTSPYTTILRLFV